MDAVVDGDVEILDSVVIGAGQAGLSTSYHLRRRGIDARRAGCRRGTGWRLAAPLGLADDAGRARHRGAARTPSRSAEQDGRANEVVPAYFADYERDHHLPVLRPVRVDQVVEADDGLLEVRAGDRRWLTRTIVNATGTWSRPFVPAYPGAETFRGRQLHPHDYPGRRRSAAGASSSWAAARPRCSCSARSRRSPRTRSG